MEHAKLFSLEIVDTIEKISKIKHFWESIQCHPNTDIDLYLSYLNNNNTKTPYVFIIYDNSSYQPISMLICRFENIEYKINLGYKSLFSINIKQLSILYEGIMGERNPVIFKLYLDHIYKMMKKGIFDAIYFSHLNLDPENLNLIINFPSSFLKDRHPSQTLHYRTSAAESLDDFFKRLGKKSRHNIRRTIRILESSFNNVEYKCFNSISNIEKVSADIESIASKTYHRGLQTGFILNSEFYDRLKIAATKGILEAYVLYVNEMPASFWLAFRYSDILFLDSTGYDPAYSDYEVGTILLIHIIKEISDDKKIKYIDYGFGDASYKKKYADINWVETTFYFFSPTVKGIFINIVSSLLKYMIRILKSVLKQYQLDNKIKKIWRKKMIRSMNQ